MQRSNAFFNDIKIYFIVTRTFVELNTNPISVKNLIKCSANSKFWFSCFYTKSFGEILVLNCFFINSFFNLVPCFPYKFLSIWLLKWNNKVFLNGFLMFQIVAYSFCIHPQFFHFWFLETSHTVVAYVSKNFLSQLLSRDLEYLCF